MGFVRGLLRPRVLFQFDYFDRKFPKMLKVWQIKAPKKVALMTGFAPTHQNTTSSPPPKHDFSVSRMLYGNRIRLEIDSSNRTT